MDLTYRVVAHGEPVTTTPTATPAAGSCPSVSGTGSDGIASAPPPSAALTSAGIASPLGAVRMALSAAVTFTIQATNDGLLVASTRV